MMGVAEQWGCVDKSEAWNASPDKLIFGCLRSYAFVWKQSLALASPAHFGLGHPMVTVDQY